MKTYSRAALLATLALLPGCSQQTLNSAQNDANRDAAVVSQKAKEAQKQAQPQLDKFGMQSRVSAALTAANLPTTVHVRADAGGVYLRGNVKTAEDKSRAGRIARDTLGPGKAIHNELKVMGG